MSNITLNTRNDEFVDSQCYTKLDLRKCTFKWTIDQFPILCEIQQNFKSAVFSSDDDFKWRLELVFYSVSEPPTPNTLYHSHRKLATPLLKNYVRLSLHADSDVDLKNNSPIKGNSQIVVTKPNGTEVFKEKFNFNFDTNNNSNMIKEFELDALKAMVFDDKLTMLCHLKYVKKYDIFSIPTSSMISSITKQSEIAEPSISRHLGWMLSDGHFKDMTITVNGNKYEVHKCILSARSPVFYAMFSNDLRENQKNHVEIADIQQEIFEEMLYYIYTGTTRNLEELAFEVLPVADKYELGELKNMCGQVMFKKLSLENAALILMLADMHRAEELKERTIRFIKRRSVDFKDFKKTDVWNVLTSRPELMKDMLDIFFE